MISTLYIVATPIGNLEDISARALRILSTVDLILAEDTRTSQKLLNHYQIDKALVSFHQHSKSLKIDRIVNGLKVGKNLALISEAGTPGIADPGAKLISVIRQQLGDKVKIVPIPGACALTAALSVSGWPAEKFIFLGFLAHKKGRQKQIREILDYPYLVVLYESKHRLLKLLTELSSLAKENEKEIDIMLARELTKKFEEIIFGSPDQLIEFLNNKPASLKGEFVVILRKKNKKIVNKNI